MRRFETALESFLRTGRLWAGWHHWDAHGLGNNPLGWAIKSLDPFCARAMPSDEEIAGRALHFEKLVQDIPLTQVPGYTEWSKRKRNNGESEPKIAHLEATCMWITPEEHERVGKADFKELWTTSRKKSVISGLRCAHLNLSNNLTDLFLVSNHDHKSYRYGGVE